MKRGLGTQLRHLIDLLDGAVAESYKEAGLPYRPRYTPVIRALEVGNPTTVTNISTLAGITQPAATQTIALMIRDGLVSAEPSTEDSRQRMIRLTPLARRMMPQLQRHWDAADAAAASLDADLPYPLSELLTLATDALARDPFDSRLRRCVTTSIVSPSMKGKRKDGK